MAHHFTKEFFRLLKNVNSFTDSQVVISEYDEDDLSIFDVIFQPNDGIYKGGKFRATINCTDYIENQNMPPEVKFLTPIYHPNIDRFDDDTSTGDVCLSLLSDWTAERDIEDLIMGLLFLLYHPQIDDALSPIFDASITEEEFLENVKLAMNGEDVDGIVFIIEPSTGEEKELEQLRTETRTEIQMEVSNLNTDGNDDVINNAEHHQKDEPVCFEDENSKCRPIDEIAAQIITENQNGIPGNEGAQNIDRDNTALGDNHETNNDLAHSSSAQVEQTDLPENNTVKSTKDNWFNEGCGNIVKTAVLYFLKLVDNLCK